MSMVLTTTDDIYLAVSDLLTEEKRRLLALTLNGPLAIPHLEAAAERLAVLTRKGTPFAAELALADKRHDIGAIVLDCICQIHALLGGLPEYAELAETASLLRDTLSMDRSIIRASYGEEVANALRNRPLLDEIAGELRAVPVARGVNAHDVAELFVGGGEELGVYLRKRADAVAEARAVRAESGSKNLLHEVRDLLRRVRATLEGEASMRDDLPAGFVDRVFSVLDARIAIAVARHSRSASSAAVDGEGNDASAPAPLDLDASDAPAAEAPSADAPAAEAPSAEAPAADAPAADAPAADRD